MNRTRFREPRERLTYEPGTQTAHGHRPADQFDDAQRENPVALELESGRLRVENDEANRIRRPTTFDFGGLLRGPVGACRRVCRFAEEKHGASSGVQPILMLHEALQHALYVENIR